MKPSIRQVLADSHVGVVVIALLLLFSLRLTFSALWPPFFRVLTFVFTAVTILDVPYFSPTLDPLDRLNLIRAAPYLYSAFIGFAAARVLSRWVYGVGPLRCLSEYRSRLSGSRHA